MLKCSPFFTQFHERRSLKYQLAISLLDQDLLYLSFSCLFSVLALLQLSGAQLEEAEQISMDGLQAQCGLFYGLPHDEKRLYN